MAADFSKRPRRTGLDYGFEAAFHGPVAGLDEAGRGPLAGPVVAAAVILAPERLPAGLADSKLLSAVARERLFEFICAHGQVGIGQATVAEIDRLNILQASLAAMTRAVEALAAQGAHLAMALVDGNTPPALACPACTVVNGDAQVASIAAASIVAKVARDRLMAGLAADWPAYGWERNKGYGTPAHLSALAAHGVTPHHRRSFAPIHKMLTEDSPITS